MMKKIYLIVAVFLSLILFCVNSYAAAPYRIVQDPKGIYVVEVTSTKAKFKLEPYVSDSLETNEAVYNKLLPKFVVNAGFFDPKNKKTVSYVVVDGKVVLDPKNNESLMKNKALSPYMSKILNRSEFRILKNEKGKIVYDITPHDEKIPEGLTLVHSIQAGPMLIPDLRLEEEFFILVRDGKIVSESASSLHKYARTAIGIKNNKVYLFIVTNDAPMNLKELSELTQNWGMEKAMAFDGGGSTSFDSKELHIISEKDNSARKLKSFLVFK
jgi:exopolysaccharide biosynthesis protein